MFVVALTVITLRWKQPKCLSTREWMNGYNEILHISKKVTNHNMVEYQKHYFEKNILNIKVNIVWLDCLNFKNKGKINLWW